jgi:small subunit ribosomal protein S7
MRGKRAIKRIVEPDFHYKSKVVSKLIQLVMQSGKKGLAEKIVYGFIARLNEDQREARRIFEDAVKNVMPQVEVRSRRVGGANYQIPVPLKHERSEALALRWIIEAARNAKGKTIEQRLLDEVNLAFKNEGTAIRKKVDTHKMAEANRAFAHLKW